MTRLLRWGTVLLVLAVVGAAAFWYSRVRQEPLATGPGDPATVALPATVSLPDQQASSETLQAYFAGAGEPVIALLRITAALPADPVTAVCEQVAGDIDAVEAPDGLTDAALGIPDPTVRDAAVGHVSAVLSYLGTCGTADHSESAAAEAGFTATVLSRLLSRAGVK